jgi:hypothetical protein
MPFGKQNPYFRKFPLGIFSKFFQDNSANELKITKSVYWSIVKARGRAKVWTMLADGCNVSTDEILKVKVKMSYEKMEVSSAVGRPVLVLF